MSAENIIFFFLLGLGSVQGLVMGVILLVGKSPKRKSNQFLGALLLFLSYHLIKQLLWKADISSYQSTLYYILLEYSWIYGPLIYFHIASALNPNFRIGKRDWLYFIPVVVQFGFSLFVKIQNLYWDGTEESLSWAGNNAYVLWMHTPFQYIVSAGLMFYCVWKARKEMIAKGYLEKLTAGAYQQVSVVLIVYLSFSIMVILTCMTDYLFFNYAFSPFYIFPVFITTSVLIYWHGLIGFANRNELPELKPKTKSVKEIINPEELQILKPLLNKLMEEDKVYLDATITLQTLAEKMGIKPYILTQLLNREYGKPFSMFMAEYRVAYVLEMMKKTKYQHYTLLAIALESGFNSKASFNRVFKKITGKSPKNVQEELQRDSNI